MGRRVATPAALLLAATLGVHELRYLIVFGGDAELALARHGHGYLRIVVPVLVMCCAAICAVGLVRMAGEAGRRGDSQVLTRRLWPAATVALLGLYGGQELLEGWLAAGHPSGWDALFAGNGWVAAPLALAFGLLVALSVRMARAISAACGGRLCAPRPRAASVAVPRSVVARHGDRRDRLLARHLAGRAPPRVHA